MKHKNGAVEKTNSVRCDVVSSSKSSSETALNNKVLTRHQKLKQETRKRSQCKQSCEALSRKGKKDLTDLSSLQNKKLQEKIQSPVLTPVITVKLQNLFKDLVSEVQNIPQNETSYGKHIKSKNAPTTLKVENFLNSAKSRIYQLLNNEQPLVSNLPSPAKKSKSFIDPLELQLSLRLQHLLCRALDNKNLGCTKTEKTSPEIDISETEWHDFSGILQGFMNTAKKKLSYSLSNKSKSDSKHNNQAGCPKVPKLYNSPYNSPSNIDCKLNKTEQKYKMETHSSDSECSGQDGQAVFRSNIYDNSSTILLLGECEKTPDFLDLGVDSDVDDPSFEDSPSDSGEEVVLLGEKRPTYQEVTLEEDESGKVVEKVIEKEKPLKEEKDEEELLFECPQCDKSFRVESLLKFHIRMHGVPDASVPEYLPTVSSLSRKFNNPPEKSSKSNHNGVKKEKENSTKTIAKTLFNKHKVHRDKHRRKVKDVH